MATLIHFLPLLFVACVAVPVKPRSPHGATDCYGTECFYNYDYQNTAEVSFQSNYTDAVLNALPDIIGSQYEMVTLMNKTLISQESAVEKLDYHFKNIAFETRLQNIETSLENMTMLMSKMVELGLQHNLELGLLHNQVNGIHSKIARDCSDYAARGITNSGSYVITPQDGAGSLKVYCDFRNINIEGWTVIQKRYDGSVDFHRNWAEYEKGFGDSNGEYWLGLKNIHRLISDGSTWALRVDLESFDGESAYAVYDSFSISDAADNYRLAVGEYIGTAGDSLKYSGGAMLNGMQFSTFDRDNDQYGNNCASKGNRGGFWFNSCQYANPNGQYLGRSGDEWSGMIWYTWKDTQSLKTCQMKIRRVL